MVQLKQTLRFAACCALSAFGISHASADDEISFQDDVAPILEQHCLSCHDDRVHEGDFSLQSAATFFESGYVERGNATASDLIDAVTLHDGKARMPKDAESLNPKEVKALSQWINDGAAWPAGLRLQAKKVSSFDWWSFHPIERPKVPQQTAEVPWCQNPIDAFVLQGQKQKGLKHSDQADRRTLIRRLTFDLIGLPPTPDEVIAFENDNAPDAYDRVVDRLLESKHYGERWARHWLDVVQYADTCGYDKDKLRPNAWPYRDYVIRSFNEDKPYNRFVQEQIAGDVLFPGTADGIVALGFIAAGPWDFIGHVEVPESKIDGKVARNLDRDNMVSNTLNTFCSVTIQCARCHDHKFDPLTQQNYYSLQAVFAAVDRADRAYDVDPEAAEVRSEMTAQIGKLKTEQADLQKQIQRTLGPHYTDLKTALDELTTQESVSKPTEYGYHSQIEANAESTKWVGVELSEATDVSRVILHPCHDEFGGIGAGFGFPIRFRIEVSRTANATAADWVTVADFDQSDCPNPGLSPVEILMEESSCRSIRIVATKLAERQRDFILALAELEVFDANGKLLDLTNAAEVFAKDSIEAPQRWQKGNLVDGKYPSSTTPLVTGKIAAIQRELNTLLTGDEVRQKLGKQQEVDLQIRETELRRQKLPKGKMVYAAVTDFPGQGQFKPTKGQPRPIHVLLRGDVQRPAEAVSPGLLPLNNSDDWRLEEGLDEGQRRAALAKWLTSKDNPLLWRSIVNRVWQYHFGDGLVATPNDFGRMGALPTHPELLDWLACEFRDGRQSFKQLHRLIVTSNTYRQNSADQSKNAEIDGSNQFLWRANRRRLSAEEVRDSMLAVSGALNRTMEGPGFFLFKLEHPEHSPHYEYHKFDPTDPLSHRRSIYRFIARSQPNPWMTTLDCADSSQSTPRRNETLTSLQALSLMNNQFVLAMSTHFSAQLAGKATSLDEIVNSGFQRTLQRAPTDKEHQLLVTFAEEHGVQNLCRVLFNHSEFVFLD